MATHLPIVLWLFFTVWPCWIIALQVTPRSPCAEFCLDETTGAADQSDPQSSSIDAKDIVCSDSDFSSDETGKKFQHCLTCLQGSDFVRGSENDVDWFLYNLRYAFDYCVFGDMKASAVDASPCTTSEGCGRLTHALRDHMINSTTRSQYGYCEADDQVIHGDAFDKCLSCVSAEASHSYISNFLIALGIGCDQRPTPGKLLGLNQTVFSKHTIQAVNPSSSGTQEKTNPGRLLLPTAAIVGISVGGLVLILLALGCGYMHYRRRKNRQRASGWSFRCQAPSASLPAVPLHDDDDDDEARRRARFHRVMGERAWTSPSESHVTGLFPEPPASTMSTGEKSAATKDGITSVVVTKFPTRPAVQTSGGIFTSPPTTVFDEQHATPSSATSVRSTKPLLQEQDSPAAASYYSASSFGNNHRRQHDHEAVGGSRGRGGASPQTTPLGGTSGWDEEQQLRTAAPGPRSLTGSPVMTRQVEVRKFSNTTFPPPPRA